MPSKILQKINTERQTVKSYSEARITEADWKQVVQSMQWSPSSFGLEPYRMLIINRTNTELLAKIRLAAWNQGVVTEADKLVIFISYKRVVFTSKEWLNRRLTEVFTHVQGKNETVQKTVTVMNNMMFNWLRHNEPNGDAWAMKQAYIALGTAMQAATLLNIGSTPMEGFERAKLEKILSEYNLIDAHTETVAVLCAFGYPKSPTAYAHWGSGKRVRVPFDQKFIQM